MRHEWVWHFPKLSKALPLKEHETVVHQSCNAELYPEDEAMGQRWANDISHWPSGNTASCFDWVVDIWLTANSFANAHVPSFTSILGKNSVTWLRKYAKYFWNFYTYYKNSRVLVQYWTTVCDASPTLHQQCLNVSCWLCIRQDVGI